MAGAYAYVIRRVHIADARRCAGGATRWSIWSSNVTGAGSGPGPREPERSGQLKNNRIRAPPTPATDPQLPPQAVGRIGVSAATRLRRPCSLAPEPKDAERRVTTREVPRLG